MAFAIGLQLIERGLLTKRTPFSAQGHATSEASIACAIYTRCMQYTKGTASHAVNGMGTHTFWRTTTLMLMLTPVQP